VLPNECCVNYLQSFCENVDKRDFFFFFMDQVLQNHGFFLDVLAKITSRIWDVEQLFQSSLTNVELLQDYSIIMMILKSHHRIINVSSI
jgi:hypothetical protein